MREGIVPGEMTSRQLKKQVAELLQQSDFSAAMAAVGALPPRQVIGPLFSRFYGVDELLRWRAISAMGHVVSGMADAGEMESARIVMRRLMWHLNDESGGIGWGCPEAMGEITARHARLAEEFHRILISYVMEEGNFLEHEMLQRGVLWGIGRLAAARPNLAAAAAPHLPPFFTSPDPFHRGLAVWAALPIADPPIKSLIQNMADDTAELTFYWNGGLYRRTVSQFATGRAMASE